MFFVVNLILPRRDTKNFTKDTEFFYRGKKMENLNFRRLRRLRYNPIIRDMVRETHLSKSDFIYPLFVVNGTNIKKEVSSMPGVYQQSIDNIVKECKE